MEHAQAHIQKAANLFFQREILIALPCHVAAHHAGCAQLHLVKVALRALRQVAAESRAQFRRRAAVNDLQRARIGIRFHIDVAQVFVHFRQRQLQRRFRRIDIRRRRRFDDQLPDFAELSAEHDIDKFAEHAVLGMKNILERTGGNVGRLENFRHFGVGIAVFQKKSGASGENPPFGIRAVVSARHQFSPSSRLIFKPIIFYFAADVKSGDLQVLPRIKTAQSAAGKSSDMQQ